MNSVRTLFDPKPNSTVNGNKVYSQKIIERNKIDDDFLE